MSAHDQDVVDALRRVSRRLAPHHLTGDLDASLTEIARAAVETVGPADAAGISLAERARELERTAETRELIGQAKGILMERHTLDDEAASRMLAALSQDAGTTPVDTAQWMRGRARHRHAESVALPDRDPHETAEERDQIDAERAAWGHGTDGA